MMHVITMRVEFSGMYGWGVGWLSGWQSAAWNEWFENLEDTVHPSFWGYFKRNAGIGSQHLVCASGSVYLHPMSMVCTITSTLTSKRMENGKWVIVYPEMEELKDILTGAANACGGTVEFSSISDVQIDVPDISKEENGYK
jgi:hypothetical protein